MWDRGGGLRSWNVYFVLFFNLSIQRRQITYAKRSTRTTGQYDYATLDYIITRAAGTLEIKVARMWRVFSRYLTYESRASRTAMRILVGARLISVPHAGTEPAFLASRIEIGGSG